MLDALFSIGTLIVKKVAKFAVDVIKDIVKDVVRDFVGVPKSSTAKATTVPSSDYISNIKDLDREVSDLERKRNRDSRLNSRDADRLEELETQRREAAQHFRETKQREIIADVQASGKDYVAPDLIDNKVHILQYHMGQMVLEKRCSRCQSPMALQHKRIPDPVFGDFFWSCTRYYGLREGERPCPTMPFRPQDIQLLHQEGIPELEEDRDDLEFVASQPIARQTIQKRVNNHKGQEDNDVLCPIHHLPMTLREKRENDGTLIDLYFLVCPHQGCQQTVKLKSVAQIAAYLRRQEGRGILS